MTETMSAARSHRRWFGRASLIALVYAVAGVGFGALAGPAGSQPRL